MTQLTLEHALTDFLHALEGKNKSKATIKAYHTDIHQFIEWLHENNLAITAPADVQRADMTKYFSYLFLRRLTGTARARKFAALRSYFKYLVDHDVVAKSPLTGIESPKREKHTRTRLTHEEYTKLLSLAGANARDYAMLQVFLQTGLRVSELVALSLDDIDFAAKKVYVRAGKGMAAREIELEKKVIQALKNYLATRPPVAHDRLFLNRYNEPFSARGVEKLIVRYVKAAGIRKQATCHSLRHTFASAKADQGVSVYRLKEWLGHQSLETTQIYIHLSKQNAQREMEQTSL